jgi:hypothetical protein
VRDSASLLRRIFRFIEVDPEIDLLDLQPANQRQRVRSARLQFFLRRRLEPILGRLRLGRARRWLDRLAQCNIASDEPIPMLEDTRQQLTERYRADLEVLERLTGLDTSLWRGVPAAKPAGRRDPTRSQTRLHGSGPQRRT